MGNQKINVPKGKIKRASTMMKTGAKVGGNYLKYWTKKALGSEVSKSDLDKDNAEDIFNSLTELRGGALKVAQMLSMDHGLLPTQYQQQFANAQYNVPPLSYPFVVKSFKQAFNQTPSQIFDSFDKEATKAASIGQVHQAFKAEKKYAVKVQYPNIAESIDSDISMLKSLALRALKMKERDSREYFEEVKNKLVEETDYIKERKNGERLAQLCQGIENLIFPKYYEEFSTNRILTMDWLDGLPVPEFLAKNPSQEVKNKAGQALWDFYNFQVRILKEVHADPHPGNFLVFPDGQVGVIDFGCIKKMPIDFHEKYIRLSMPHELDNEQFKKLLHEVDLILDNDTEEDKQLILNTFGEILHLVSAPFLNKTFDFSDDDFFNQINQFRDEMMQNKDFRKLNYARGSKHFIFLNRANFGLYNILHDLGAKVNTENKWDDI